MNEVPFAYLLCSPVFHCTYRYSSRRLIDGCGPRTGREGSIPVMSSMELVRNMRFYDAQWDNRFNEGYRYG